MKSKRPLHLFVRFFLIGCCTFGGGWSIVAQIQQQYVDREQALTQQELLDLTSVARSLPGTMIGNVAMLFGYRMGGIGGGIFCTLGLILPPLLILSVITCCYEAFRDSAWCTAAMMGVRAAVVPMILKAALSMVRGAFPRRSCILIFAGGLAAYLGLQINSILLILLGALWGLLFGREAAAV